MENLTGQDKDLLVTIMVETELTWEKNYFQLQ